MEKPNNKDNIKTESEKELRRLFKENNVPVLCSSGLYYTMFMPKGIREHLRKLLYIVFFAVAIPGVVLFILWHTGFSYFHYDRRVLVTIAIAVIWVVFFIVIYFNIYVRTKIRYLEVIREGRKYRDAINKSVRERKKNLKSNK